MHNVDWQVVATVAAPIIALFIGAWLDRKVERKAILDWYLGHVSAFKYTAPGGNKLDIYTHSIVLSNNGRRTATGVRVHHTVLPDFNIAPSVPHSIETLPDGTRDIVVPSLVPGEVLTISYLYFPPVTWAQVNAGIKSDTGFARSVTMLLQRQYPQWFNITGAALMLIGLITLAYFAVSVARHWLG